VSDLFTDLYRYRQREKKNNLEDWLTECVAAILRSLPKSAFSEFASRLTGQSSVDIEDVYDHISIATQVTIERGSTGTQRPDLLISIAAPENEGKKEPSQPWLLFENKVFHHVDEQELENGQTENQLHRYGTWLCDQPFDRPQLNQTIVFITHGTPAPSDFKVRGPSHPAYGSLGRVEKSWGEIAAILDEVTSEHDNELHFRALINAYQEFLEEHGMADEYPEYRDYAALAGFIETVEPFKKLVDEMIGKLDGVAPFYGRVVWASADAEEGTYNAHRYLVKEKRYDEWTFLSTGIWFPDRGEGFYTEEIEKADDKRVSLAPKIYIQLANREDDALTALAGKPEGNWYRPQSDFFTFRDVASFPPDPGEAATEILKWIEIEGLKLKALLQG
jgi:hypothetical protein